MHANLWPFLVLAPVPAFSWPVVLLLDVILNYFFRTRIKLLQFKLRWMQGERLLLQCQNDTLLRQLGIGNFSATRNKEL